MEKKIFCFIFFIVFLIGGLIQFLGLLSNTKMTALLALSIIPIIFVNSRFRDIRIDKVSILFILLFLLIIVSGIANESDFQNVIFYFIYVIVPFNIYYIFEVVQNKEFLCKVFRFSYYIAIIQLPILIIQLIFYNKLIDFSSYPISQLDFNFGTFFLQDDHALSFFILCWIIIIIFNDKIVFSKKHFFFTLFHFSITILLTNSKIAHLILILIFIIYFFKIYLDFKKIIFYLIIGGCILSITYFTNLHQNIIKNVTRVYAEVDKDVSTSEVERLYRSKKGSRFITLSTFFNGRLKIIGEGPFSFYDPLNKMYLGGANQSQLLWFYYDIGIIGPIILIIILYIQSFRLMANKFIALLLFLLLCLYSFVTNVFSDIAIIISYNLFLRSGVLNRENISINV